jgi:ATP/maltotriose-dependent transcriptional regulator MalT
MINTSHPGTPPRGTETASDLDSATGQAGAIGDWAASLAKLLKVAFREVDTDRERAKASIAKASSLPRVHIERSSFDPAHNRLHLEQDAEGQIRSDRLEIRCRRKERREVWAKVSTSAAPSAGRLLLCLIAIDVTRRKQAAEALGDAQADLAHVARLATMGELAASIAHEINQPICAIATQATVCLRWLERDEPDLDEAREGLVRVEREARPVIDVLSRRESATVELIGQGHSNKEIARQLGIAPETVKTYVKRIFSKLGVERRAQAVSRAHALGFMGEYAPDVD